MGLDRPGYDALSTITGSMTDGTMTTLGREELASSRERDQFPLLRKGRLSFPFGSWR